MWLPTFIHLLPNLWLATYFILCLLGYSGVYDTVPLNLYTFVLMQHCLGGVYILNTLTPPSTEERGWAGTELQDIRNIILNTLLLEQKSLDEFWLLFSIILINYIN